MNYIEQMFDLQRQLNDHTNGVMWVDGITKENRKISWYRCIYMEAAEAIDSFNWKSCGREGHIDKFFARNKHLRKYFVESGVKTW